MPKSRKDFDPDGLDYSGGSHLARSPISFDTGGRVPHSEDGNPARMLMDSPRQKTHPGVRVPGPYSTQQRQEAQQEIRNQIGQQEQESHELDIIENTQTYENAPTLHARFSEDAITNHDIDSTKNYYTMSGTIKRGKKKKEEIVEVQVQLTEQEVNKLQQSYIEEGKENNSKCGLDRGPHIVLFTILFIPFAFFASLGYSFYIGVISWYNIYLYLSEEKTIFHKIFLCPIIILFFPFLIVIAAVGLGIFGAVKQISWYFRSWLKEMRDLEKGFYGWLFNKMGIEKCCPYEVVILDDPNPGSQVNPMMTLRQENPNPVSDSSV